MGAPEARAARSPAESTSRLSREEFAARQSEEFVEQAFGGSLPKFLTAFTRRKKLTDEEVRQLQQLIDESRR